MSNEDIRAFYKRAQKKVLNWLAIMSLAGSLFRAPYSKNIQDADIVIVGIPLDIGVPNPRPGTRNAPAAVRFWGLDRNMVNYYNNLCPFDICNIIDYGDMEFQDDMYNLKSNLNEITKLYKEIYKAGAVPLTIGGEHTCTYAILRALGNGDIREKNSKRNGILPGKDLLKANSTDY